MMWQLVCGKEEGVRRLREHSEVYIMAQCIQRYWFMEISMCLALLISLHTFSRPGPASHSAYQAAELWLVQFSFREETLP